MRKLQQYKQKRNFNATSEPSGSENDSKTESKNKSLKFLIQYHDATRLHYDFRLEWDGVLLSWAVPKGPSYNPEDKRLAVQVEDHPLEYADFEGTIPAGEYGGGTVMLWDEGTWTPRYDVEKSLAKGALKMQLDGQRIKGKWALIRLKNSEKPAKNWLLIKEKDQYTKKTSGITRFKTSIVSGRTLKEIAKADEVTAPANPFDKIDVQLAKLTTEIPDSSDWLFEIKFDGYRIVAFIENNKVILRSRNQADYTAKFQDIADDLAEWATKRSMVLDGEMTVVDETGRTDFQALQNRIKHPNSGELSYMVFDLLALDGQDLRQLPLSERKDKLRDLLKKAPPGIVFSEHVKGKGQKLFDYAASLNFEGIIGKKADSLYLGKRQSDWIKIKCRHRQEFVIGGYMKSDKDERSFRSLLLGVYADGKFVYSGRVGTGFNDESAADLLGKFQKIKTTVCPFTPKIKSKNERLVWLKPQLVAEVEFAEWTKENQLRQASFKGLRTDKKPRQVVREQSESEKNVKPKHKEEKSARLESLKISSPERQIYSDPPLTKLDVAEYYDQVAERMLDYVDHRILAAVRCHQGVKAECFFKKHPVGKSRYIRTVALTEKDGSKQNYFYIDDRLGLVSEVQLGTVEFHIWGSRVNRLEQPDLMVFDLDPDEGMDLEQVRQGVRDLKKTLEELSLRSFLKTSGGKGYHIVVPFKPAPSWRLFHDFARQIAEFMEEKWPERYTSNVRKNKRKGKIFIDWIRNGRGATSVAPYSLRAHPGAPVSMPIAWNELDKVAPNGIDLNEALKRLRKKDPWSDFYKVRQSLSEVKKI